MTRELTPLHDPPRHGDSWEVAGWLTAAYLIEPQGFGLMARGHAVYRGDEPYYLRAELMPLTISVASPRGRGDGTVIGALAMASAGLDLHAFGLGLSIGAATDREQPGDEGVLVVGASARIGFSDGLRVIIRGGISTNYESIGFGFVEALPQIPFTPETALRLRFAYSVSGNMEAFAGLRVWLEGHGEAGSVGLTVGAGFMHAQHQRVDHNGPPIGVGLEGRL